MTAAVVALHSSSLQASEEAVKKKSEKKRKWVQERRVQTSLSAVLCVCEEVSVVEWMI